jgi:hypothetical protein
MFKRQNKRSVPIPVAGASYELEKEWVRVNAVIIILRLNSRKFHPTEVFSKLFINSEYQV